MENQAKHAFYDEVVLISKFTDRLEEIHMDLENTPWLHKVMDKITQDFDKDEFPANCEKLEVDIKYKRDLEDICGEYLWVEGKAQGSYYANCIRCLTNVPMSFECEFKGAYINSRLENNDDFVDLDEVWINSQLADLHFHVKGKANIRDIVSENVFLAVNQYPVCNESCKGLCHTCGVDLNKVDCGHKN